MAFVTEVELRHDLVKWIDWYTNDNNHRFCERITRYMIYFEEQGEENRSERALNIYTMGDKTNFSANDVRDQF